MDLSGFLALSLVFNYVLCGIITLFVLNKRDVDNTRSGNTTDFAVMVFFFVLIWPIIGLIEALDSFRNLLQK